MVWLRRSRRLPAILCDDPGVDRRPHTIPAVRTLTLTERGKRLVVIERRATSTIMPPPAAFTPLAGQVRPEADGVNNGRGGRRRRDHAPTGHPKLANACYFGADELTSRAALHTTAAGARWRRSPTEWAAAERESATTGSNARPRRSTNIRKPRNRAGSSRTSSA